MKFNGFFGLVLSAVMAGCGGGDGDGAAPSSSPAPLATLTPEPEPAPPVASPNPSTVTTASVTPATPAMPGLVAPSDAITSADSCGLANFQADVLRAVNAARAQTRTCGSGAKPATTALTWSNTLLAAATAHSQDMAQRNYFSHTSPEGKTTSDRAQLAGYRFTALGENIAASQPSVALVTAGWLASEGHCLNIMNAAFTEVGVACFATSRAMYPTYWTMVLGRPP